MRCRSQTWSHWLTTKVPITKAQLFTMRSKTLILHRHRPCESGSAAKQERSCESGGAAKQERIYAPCSDPICCNGRGRKRAPKLELQRKSVPFLFYTGARRMATSAGIHGPRASTAPLETTKRQALRAIIENLTLSKRCVHPAEYRQNCAKSLRLPTNPCPRVLRAHIVRELAN